MPGRVDGWLWPIDLVALSVLVLPLTPLARVFGFVPLALYRAVLGIAGAHVVSAELLKRWFYRRYAAQANVGLTSAPGAASPAPAPGCS